jgi:hypothetical protein
VRIGGAVFDERPIDLHTVHIQQLEPRQRRVAGAEVIRRPSRE